MARLPEQVVAALSPFVAEADLRAMRAIHRGPLCWTPRLLGMGAVTFDRWVVFRAGQFRPDTPQGLGLIAHEAFHITQRRRMGLARFLLRYMAGQFTSGFNHDRHPLERPAIALQQRVVAALTADSARAGRQASADTH